MLQVKTVSQFTHTYQVPDALSGDFLRWLNANEDKVEDYEIDQQFIHEFIVHAGRIDDPVPEPGTEQRQAFEAKGSRASIAGNSK